MIEKHIKLNKVKTQEYQNINVLLQIPNTIVLAVGPPSCVRQLYFAVQGEKQNDRFYMYAVDEKKLALGQYVEEVRAITEQLLLNKPKMLILYLSCIDLILGSDFNQLIEELQANTQTYLLAFKRGPLEKRKIGIEEKIKKILSQIIEKPFFAEEEQDTIRRLLEAIEHE